MDTADARWPRQYIEQRYEDIDPVIGLARVVFGLENTRSKLGASAVAQARRREAARRGLILSCQALNSASL
ncbi:MAG: autoinducer binding domain-containing protein [Alphaproteobacteria bacterium]|nr:autoinducer binding domain-containing protein [Alphaproteobacteria bacterium]